MWASIRPNTGSGVLGLGMVTAAGTLGSIAAAAATVPALTTLATAATARKRRRVGSRGGNIMGWSIADVFVGGVLCTLSAWVMEAGSLWLGLEPGRKLALPLGLPFVYTISHGQARQNCTQKADGPATRLEIQRDDPRAT